MLFFNRKQNIAKSSIFNGYVESHSHLLPDVDDGVQEMDETLSILARFETLGLHDIWITPHIMEDMPNTTKHLREVFQTLLTTYKESPDTEGTLQLHLAAEYMLDKEFDHVLSSGDFLLHSEKHLLVETSYYNPPANFSTLLQRIKEKGIIPLLAHPERYEYMDIDDYAQLKRKGIHFQMNLPSLLGYYGHTAQKKAQKMLDNGWYNAIGMDLHSASQLDYILEGKLSKKEISNIQMIYITNLYSKDFKY